MNAIPPLSPFSKFRALCLLAALAALSPAAPLSAEEAPPPAAPKVIGRTVAVVNDEAVFAEDMEREAEPFIERYKKTVPEKEQTAEKVLELKKEILDRIIEEKLLLQEAKKKQIRATKSEIERGIAQFKEPFSVDADGKPRSPAETEKKFQDQLAKEGMTQDQFNKRVEEQILKVKLIEQEVKSKVELPKADEAKKYFEKIQQKMAGKAVPAKDANEEADLAQLAKYLERVSGEQARIRHILLRAAKSDPAANKEEARKKAEEVAQKLKSGEDFAFLAKKYSDDPLSKERGGDLGFVAKGDLGLPEIDAALVKMKEGEVSGVLQTEIGFHLIKLVEKKAPHPVEFEDVREDLSNFIAQKNFTERLEKFIKGLKAKSSIKINPIE